MEPSERDRHALSVLARGDLDGLGRIYDAYAERIYHLVVVSGLDEFTARDVVQETFLALLDRGPSVNRIRNLPAYLAGTARKIARRRARANKRWTSATKTMMNEASVDSWDETRDRIVVRDALRKLPHNQAEVVALKVWQGLSFEEIGRTLGLSPNTAASRYRYALAKLRTLLGEYWDERKNSEHRGLDSPNEAAQPATDGAG